MKLLLTSSGLDNKKVQKEFLELLEGKPVKTKVLIIFGVKKEEHWEYVKESKQELIDLGILNENITEANISENISEKKFESNFDVIYVCGGNTYYILDRLRKTGLDNIIKKLVSENKLYIGVSAGSIIAGPNIRIAGWGIEKDPNEVGLKDLDGFNFIDISFFPHYRNELKQEVDEFEEKINYKIERFKDGEGLMILNNKIKKI